MGDPKIPFPGFQDSSGDPLSTGKVASFEHLPTETPHKNSRKFSRNEISPSSSLKIGTASCWI